MRDVTRVLGLCLAALVVASSAPAVAGTCGSPAKAYFYYGVPVQVGALQQVLVPAKAEPGSDVCSTGAPVDAFVVPPGVHFVVGELHVHVTSDPAYRMLGLGISTSGTAKKIAGPGGATFAQTPVTAVDPTAVGGSFRMEFPSYGHQDYRGVAAG
ncbi:MAG TPA: hypothetical protein VM840_07700 [Actinomycetota bacterium]|nr:hypothetical protein [Actinomycetota bacterium]